MLLNSNKLSNVTVCEYRWQNVSAYGFWLHSWDPFIIIICTHFLSIGDSCCNVCISVNLSRLLFLRLLDVALRIHYLNINIVCDVVFHFMGFRFVIMIDILYGKKLHALRLLYLIILIRPTIIRCILPPEMNFLLITIHDNSLH